MSSYLVSPAHVAAIVRASSVRGSDAVAAATALHAVNADAVNRRYTTGPREVGASFGLADVALGRRLSAVESLKAIDGFAYQLDRAALDTHSAALGCKVGDWLEAAKAAAIRALPGYDAAAWEIR